MADTKISELPAGGAGAAGDVVPAVQGGVTVKLTLTQLATFVEAGLGTLAAKNSIDVPGDVTATGTPDATTYLRGDGTWSSPGGGGIPDAPSDSTSYARKDAAWEQLASVATSGSYDDLSGKPTIPAAQVNSDWNAVSGAAEILNKPSIPADPVNADWNSSSGLSQILNKPSIPAAPVNADWTSSSGLSEILNKPTIPAPQVNADWNAGSGVAQILNKPDLSLKRDLTNNAFPRYDLASAVATAALDLATQQVFRVDASTNRTLTFSNAPGANRAMAVLVRVTGSTGTITWPSGIAWSDGAAPVLRTAWTLVTLLWDGVEWSGYMFGGDDL